MAPWKDLTDRFDELEAWFEDLERRVDRDLAEVDEQERRGGDTSDFIVSLKVAHTFIYRSKCRNEVAIGPAVYSCPVSELGVRASTEG